MNRPLGFLMLLGAPLAFWLGILSTSAGCDGCYGADAEYSRFAIESGDFHLTMTAAEIEVRGFAESQVTIDSETGLVTLHYSDAEDISWTVSYLRTGSVFEDPEAF